ncbi:ECF RNA polymerase sigma factor EcfG [Andreprevotia sp. IGB-42]|uniref:RNA polymerase sigma factor n=1 Tax=Andreprevotia sp. IGB-42 TaxID=2497473 RepID=UPI00157F12A1|nr:RNA polymerase sigma factor [Andreprevotia sp. IGB-42]KAF0814051.1 ECF RNA polymerase sigma factor EcfG [Andreprevotia sp. IGB-42]
MPGQAGNAIGLSHCVQAARRSLAVIWLEEKFLATQQELSDFLGAVQRRAFRQAMFAVQDEDTALDLVQDAMLRLADRYAGKPAEELPLLFQRILQNVIRDHFRRQKTRGFWTVLLSAFQSDDAEADTSDPLEWLPNQPVAPSPEMEHDQARMMALIEEGIAKLPTRQREAFLLRYWEEMDVAETAAVMGCSEGSVKTHCSRANAALATWLNLHGVSWSSQ